MKTILIPIVILAATLAACGDSSSASPTSTVPPTVPTMDPAVPVDPAICDRNNTTDCSTLGFVFAAPGPLSETLEVLDGWLVVAVARAEPACVVVPNWPDNEDGIHEESRFAYVDAHLIRERRLNAPGSPPITGHHIASGYWGHFEEEWRVALEDDALITMAIVYAPNGTTAANAGVVGLEDVVPISSYRADSTDERFPGELYVDGHEIPPHLDGPMERVTCTL